MHHLLEEILIEKQNEVVKLKKSMPLKGNDNLPPLRDFKAAITVPNKISLIAEIKFASPSTGFIHKKADPTAIGRIYEKAGAASISFLTDKRFFKGDLNQLPHLKRVITLPILRKDFIIDEVQIQEAFLYGADAILLIARILSRYQLQEFIFMSRELGMAPLTEVHDRGDLEKAIDCGAEIIGINNRDLDSFKVDIRKTVELSSLVPENRIIISESGIDGKDDILFLKESGIDAVLVGSALMRSKNMAKKTGEIVHAGAKEDG